MADGISVPSADAASRISKVVKRVESTPLKVGKHGPAPRDRPTKFWALIYEISLTGDWDQKRYSWWRVDPSSPKGDVGITEFSVDRTRSGGFENAFEASGRVTTTGTIVELNFAGYDGDGISPVYVFIAPGQDLQREWVAIHDHRDNFNGGFAFAVYHPGTSLPQQPWSI